MAREEHRDAYRLLVNAVADLLHGDPCSPKCANEGQCGACVGRLEDAAYHAQEQIRTCERCGRGASGWAFINDDRHCHGDGRHCYEEAQHEQFRETHRELSLG